MRWKLLIASAVVAVSLGAGAARAVLPDEMLKDPALESRARSLSKEVRCQVCQNENIDDSSAPLAADLRRLVRERIVAGDSDGQILEFLRQRYGDNVLMRPPVEPQTWILWFGPPALLLVAASGLVAMLRRRPTAPEPDLAPEDEKRARDLLERNT